MALFPVKVLTKNQVKLRWEERYTSEGLNQKFLGIPNGVYLGFIPSSTAGTDVLDLALDTTQGVSVLRVKSSLGPYVVDLISEEIIKVDFTGHVGFPVYVFAKANYRINLETTAEIRTRLTPPNGIDEIGICKINSLGVTPSIDFAVAPDRHAPIANTGIAFGFMTGGAEQDRTRAVATSDEVDTARVDVAFMTWPDLRLRLLSDFATIASRLTRSVNLVRGNVHVVPQASLPVTKLIASTSFGSKTRQFEPKRRYDQGGNIGIGSAGFDGYFQADPDNIASVVNTQTGQLFADVNGNPVFARLSAEILIVTTGTSTFANALGVVNGSGDYVADGVVSGMTILGPDGNDYEVTGVGVGSLTISPVYLGVGANLVGAVARKIEASFFSTNGAGGETAFSFTAGNPLNLSLQLFFHVAETLVTSQRRSTLDLLGKLGLKDPSTPSIDQKAGFDASPFPITAANPAASKADTLPIGGIIAWWRPTISSPIPFGFEVCDGHTVTDVASTSYFGKELPDLVNKFIRGQPSSNNQGGDANNGGGNNSAVTTGGVDTHNHAGVTGGTAIGILLGGGGGAINVVEGAKDPHSHTISTDNNVPAFVGLIYLIRTK